MINGEEQAARLTGALWEAIRFSGGTDIETHRHFPGTFDPEWLATLPLPSADMLPSRQPAALINSAHHEFERHIDTATLRAAYERRARTRVYEDIGWDQDGTWAALASRHLSRLSDGPRVVVSVYESGHGDETLHPHRDAWFGVIVQVSGVKDWQVGEGLLEAGQPATPVRMAAGDVLLLPKNQPHLVTTPADPGHSVHLVFAVDRDLMHSL
jgi:hypothetical protein